MVVCILFVFLCILEFTVITALIRRGHDELSKRTDRTCRILVPVMFAIFNAVDWPILLGSGPWNLKSRFAGEKGIN